MPRHFIQEESDKEFLDKLRQVEQQIRQNEKSKSDRIIRADSGGDFYNHLDQTMFDEE